MSSVLTFPNNGSTSPPVDPGLRLSPMLCEKWSLTDAPVAQMSIVSILASRNGDAQATDLDGLVASIRSRGVLQPLIVSPDGRLLAGRRRLEAARRAGLDTVPVRVCEIASERAAIEISLVENGERSDLDPLTRAKSYRALIEQGATVEEIADLVGQGTSHVYQHLQLLDLHGDVQQALHTHKVTFADARALAPLELQDQASVLREIHISAKPLTTRQVKTRVDARRVMRLVRQANDQPSPSEGVPENAEAPQGNYAALFEKTDQTDVVGATEVPANPLDELNALIGEMVTAAQGEDQVRVWARRLSHILETLQVLNLEAGNKQNSASAVQDRLL